MAGCGSCRWYINDQCSIGGCPREIKIIKEKIKIKSLNDFLSKGKKKEIYKEKVK